MSRARPISAAQRRARYCEPADCVLDVEHSTGDVTFYDDPPPRPLTPKQRRRLQHKRGRLDARWSGRAKR